MKTPHLSRAHTPNLIELGRALKRVRKAHAVYAEARAEYDTCLEAFRTFPESHNGTTPHRAMPKALAAAWNGHGDVDALGRKRRVISPAARARMSRAMRKSHAKRRHQSGLHSNAQIEARRKVTAALLAKYDTKEPRPAFARAVASLIRHGYLTQKGDGFIRTAKPFSVKLGGAQKE